ncbi:MAG: fibrillarin-like rRNA/tRNA 2'-O-methyltransferase [Thermoplasmata archaeon]|nr:fibrillarin-like rRNA/tRNA 2'-O-methyltransferase [Thermoplasmata archaeon]
MERTAWGEVYRHGKDLYTRNARPGERVYGEDLLTDHEVEYRHWDPWRSKLAALLLKAAPQPWFVSPRSLLYLGGAHGTTVSHLSDALPDASLYVVEKSPVSFAPLLALSRRRANLYPLLADAQLPERYRADVGEVDLLYQDVAQRTQAQIFAENAEACLRGGGRGILMLKVRSVTQRRSGPSVVAEARRTLEQRGWKVRATEDLTPFARDHIALMITG